MIHVHPMFNEVILTFAWFAAVNALVSLAVLIVSGLLDDTITATPRRARWLALIRLAPAGLAAVAAGAIFLPGHIELEPPTVLEWVGPWTLTLGLCGIILMLRSAVRFAWTTHKSVRLTRGAERQVRKGSVALTEVPLLPGIALAG